MQEKVEELGLVEVMPGIAMSLAPEW